MAPPLGWASRPFGLLTRRSPSAGIARGLTAALGVILLVVALVGATSLVLALRIYQSIDASAQEFGRIQKLDQVHSIFDDLIWELDQIYHTQQFDHVVDALLLQEELERQLDRLSEVIQPADGLTGREAALLGDLHLLSQEGRAMTNRLSATGHFAKSDFEWLNRATHRVPRLTEELVGLHEFRITRLQERSQYLAQAIVALFTAFTIGGVALVVVARFGASRFIANPLYRLANAAQGIADGHLETRVTVRQANEIGLLARTFNAMAERLQQHEHEMRSAHDTVEQKMREIRALYQIGTEIARLQQLDRILQLVVDKARELLRVDVATLRLLTPQGGDLVPPARSGPPEAFRSGDGPPVESVTGDGDTGATLTVRPDYGRGRLEVPIQVGEKLVGTLHVGTCEERAFGADETELLFGLATQSANAIERVRLSEEVRSLAVIQERERLAREMHDGLAQELGLLHLKLYGALERSGEGPIADAMREMVHITDHAYEEVRQSIFGLRTFVSRGLGLVPTLTEFLHEFSAKNGIKVELDVADGTFVRLPPAVELQVVRIIQEALANVRKHARVDRARVRLQRSGEWIRVVIEDRGVGWDASTASDRRHFGLQGMRERAEGLGGRLQIDSVPGRGTRIVATVPGGHA